ncbi:alpha/beta hydrolase [Mycolicibacterium iranicum]|uniref:alpha/beta hydrolase n=1 Tax=Mycolicibacterium iranicum TaxID=912594 RepID=UPI00046447F8|nr:alpha/beta fold hydrolase [Mycolicibacterium iranicum]
MAPAPLEVIDKGGAGPAHPVPLLFVHGAWHAAWCWDEHFLNFFADKGYRAVALSLRGHGNSPSDKPLRALSINDYVDDVATVAATLPTPPVVIGHSMGGFVVQKFLESRDIPAGVLMASAPPRGYFASGIRWLRRHPGDFLKLSATGKSLPYVSSPELARERFFSRNTPEAVVLACAARLQEESARSGRDGVTVLPRPALVRAPMLVLGALEDSLAVTPDEVKATAAAYGTRPEFFPGMGHNMMIEPGWRSVAERIDSWLVSRGL